MPSKSKGLISEEYVLFKIKNTNPPLYELALGSVETNTTKEVYKMSFDEIWN